MTFLILVGMLSGCYGIHNGALSREHEAELLGWVPEDGVTTREDMIGRLGQPSSSFEGGRIWSYHFTGQGDGPLEVKRSRYWWSPSYNLILVFDSCDTVARHSFLRIKG
jgi:hypothetical protein